MENFQEGQIIAYNDAGWSVQQIAEKLNILEEDVQDILDEYAQEDDV